MNNDFVNFKTDNEDLVVEFDINPLIFESEKNHNSNDAFSSIEQKQRAINSRIEELNIDIDNLTNHADGFDYTLAVSSGIICGLIDSFFVGKYDFESLKNESYKKINIFIEKYAKQNGYTGDDRLKGAINFLENKFPVSNDSAYKINKLERFSSDRLHHLHDIAHHPTPIGLVASIICEIFGTAFFFFTDSKTQGFKWKKVMVDIDPEKRKKIIIKLIAVSVIIGIITWLTYIANQKMKECQLKISKPLRKLVLLVISSPIVITIFKSLLESDWRGHLISDMGGSKNSAAKGNDGMGIPGFFLSLLYELSSLPIIRETGLPTIINNWYSKDKFDLRKENAVLNFAKKQAIPVIINEVIVRTFYFIRHLVEEKKLKKDWNMIDWNKVKPWGNRTINRMLTISSGTFVAVDTLDAAVRSAIENGGNIHNPKLWTDFVLRINFVGVGRFAIAIYSDAKMGVQKRTAQQELIFLKNKSLMLDNAKLFYMQEGVWIAAQDTALAIEHLYKIATNSITFFFEKILSLDQEWKQLEENISTISENDPEFKTKLLTLLN